MEKMVNGDLDKVNCMISFACAKKGGALAQSVVYKYINYVADGIVSGINIFQPEALVICGCISREGDYLLNPIKELDEKHVCCKLVLQTDIRIAKLAPDAGIIGAALLGKQEQ